MGGGTVDPGKDSSFTLDGLAAPFISYRTRTEKTSTKNPSGLGLINHVVLARVFLHAQSKGLAGAGLVNVHMVYFQ